MPRYNKGLNASKSEYLDYKATCAEWKKIYGEKAENSVSLKDRHRQKEQILKGRDKGYQTGLIRRQDTIFTPII